MNDNQTTNETPTTGSGEQGAMTVPIFSIGDIVVTAQTIEVMGAGNFKTIKAGLIGKIISDDGLDYYEVEFEDAHHAVIKGHKLKLQPQAPTSAGEPKVTIDAGGRYRLRHWDTELEEWKDGVSLPWDVKESAIHDADYLAARHNDKFMVVDRLFNPVYVTGNEEIEATPQTQPQAPTSAVMAFSVGDTIYKVNASEWDTVPDGTKGVITDIGEEFCSVNFDGYDSVVVRTSCLTTTFPASAGERVTRGRKADGKRASNRPTG